MELPVIFACRWVLGILILVFGANGIFKFLTVPEMPAQATAFREALSKTRYMQPLWKGVEFFGAALLLLNYWVPFALILLAPVLVNIFCFHFFLAPKGLPLALVLLLCEGVLIGAHWDAFVPLFARG